MGVVGCGWGGGGGGGGCIESIAWYRESVLFTSAMVMVIILRGNCAIVK